MVMSLSTTRSTFLWGDSGGILCLPPELTPARIGDLLFGLGDIAIGTGRIVLGAGDTALGNGDVPLQAGETLLAGDNSLCETPTKK